MTQDTLLRALLVALDGRNPFQTAKLRQAGLRGSACDRAAFLSRFPFTTKAELLADQAANPPYGSNLTFPIDRYVRLSQTSGSSGTPLRWLDTAESWAWMLDIWDRIFAEIGVGPGDRVFVAFSFGPFLGFWTAFEAAARRGCLVIPGGGQSTRGRIEAMRDNRVTVLLCTPTYAVRLGEDAMADGQAIAGLRRIVVAGEPGGSIPAIRSRLEALWPGAVVIDHHGMTEIGPVTWQPADKPGVLRIDETAYLAEILNPVTLEPVHPGATGELVLTNLGRLGMPLLRYRTGDLVRQRTDLPGLALDGGIIGRRDDLVIVRGVNVHPSAVEAVVRRFAAIAEYQVEQSNDRGMIELALTIELWPGAEAEKAEIVDRLAESLRAALTLRIPVRVAAPGSLPRFEMKAKRWVKV